MMSIFRTTLPLLAAATLLSACVLGGGETQYRLIAPQLDAGEGALPESSDRTLAVARPDADRTRDSTRILVRRDRVLLPWSGAAWIDRAPELVQGLLVNFLDGRVATVGRYGSLPAKYRLDFVLRRFEFVEQSDGLHADIAVLARLFQADGRLLAVTGVERLEPVDGASIEAAVVAMEAGMEGVFGELAEWLQDHMNDAGAAEAKPSAAAQ